MKKKSAPAPKCLTREEMAALDAFNRDSREAHYRLTIAKLTARVSELEHQVKVQAAQSGVDQIRASRLAFLSTVQQKYSLTPGPFGFNPDTGEIKDEPA